MTNVGLNDESVVSEDFFKDLLNLIRNLNFENLNLEKLNYPGADLGDRKMRLCIQITVDGSAEKIQSCLDKFHQHSLNKDFDKLEIIIIGSKKNYRKAFQTWGLAFDIKRDVWDLTNLNKIIRALDPMFLRKLNDFLSVQLEQKFSISSSPIQITEEDIRQIIHLIHESICGRAGQKTHKEYIIGRRGDDFIQKKNAQNGVEDDFFNSEIRHSLIHQIEVDSFLKDPINAESQKEYFDICEAINKMSEENPDEFPNIETVFARIYQDVVIGYENRDIEKRKILVLLHNMYFNCDLGKNPD